VSPVSVYPREYSIVKNYVVNLLPYVGAVNTSEIKE